VLDLLLPRRCLVCARGGALLCPACLAGLPRLTPPLCERCGAPVAWPVARCLECAGRRLAFVTARAAAPYEAGVRSIVSAWKERGLRGLAAEAAALVAERVPRPGGDVVACIPADGARRLERGYHPAERLARELAARWQLPFEPLLCRTGASTPQRGLSLAERRRNVRGGFRASPVSGRVVVVDDVYTSGATSNVAAAALRGAGAAEVEVVTFARTTRAPRLGLEQGRQFRARGGV
jgi:predicted amidophosphoribosyltransferase